MSTANPILQSRVDVRAPDTVRKFAGDVGALIDQPINDVYITAGNQSTTTRTVTFQVRDRRKNIRKGRHLIVVWVGTTSEGDPSGTPTFNSPTNGVLIQSTADVYVYLTDADGLAVVDVDSASATLYLSAIWLGRAKETALVWT